MNALISVSDKTGIVEFAKELEKLGIKIISTGGTYKKLKDENVNAEVENTESETANVETTEEISSEEVVEEVKPEETTPAEEEK